MPELAGAMRAYVVAFCPFAWSLVDISVGSSTDTIKEFRALNFTMLHDDGQHFDGLEEAEVVLVGVSRTSKAPTSIYLADRVVKTGTCPSCRASMCRGMSKTCHGRSWSGYMPARNVSFRSGRTACGLNARSGSWRPGFPVDGTSISSR